MHVVTIQSIREGEAQIQAFPPTDPTNYSYREFLAFFAARPVLSPHDVTVGAFMAYGWMPRALNVFDVNNLNGVVAIVNRVKLGQFPTGDDLALLIRSINNSLVGPSKLLHFANPAICPIWDSRVFRFIEGQEPSQDDMNSVQNYLDYHRNLRDLVADAAFQGIHNSMNQEIGYWVTPFRACEYIMYSRAPFNRVPVTD
jgi:hypothetical protein